MLRYLLYGVLLLAVPLTAWFMLFLQTAVDVPCAETTEPLSLADSREQMLLVLEAAGFTAEVSIRSEHSLMLGAYPGARVLWTIRVTDPLLSGDDARLTELAASASCLRSGWVWWFIMSADGKREMIVFSETDIAEYRLEEATAEAVLQTSEAEIHGVD